MRLNQGTLDRGIRVLLGLGLLALAVVGPRTLWGLLGLVPLAIGLWGFCPLYRAFGISTRHAQPVSVARTLPPERMRPQDLR